MTKKIYRIVTGYGVTFYGKLLHRKGKPILFKSNKGAKRYVNRQVPGHKIVPIGPTSKN